MTRNTILFIHILMVLSGAAQAAGRIGAHVPKATEKPADATDPKGDSCKISKNPFWEQPIKSPSNLVDLAAIDSVNPDNLRFVSYCIDVEIAPGEVSRKKSCDTTLGRVFKYVKEADQAFKTLEDRCKKVNDDVKVCRVDQTTSEKCIADIIDKAREDFTAASKKFDDRANELLQRNEDHRKIADTLLKRLAIPGLNAGALRLPAPKALLPSNITARTPQAFKLEADTGITQIRPDQKTFCTSSGGTGEFCGHIAAATDAKFFGDQFKKASVDLSQVAEKFKLMAAQAKARADLNGPAGPNGGSDVTGGSKDDPTKKGAGGMDLNDMMKLATVGMMGAGMYCQITGKCSQKNDSSTATDPAVAEQYPSQMTNPSTSAGPQTETSVFDGKNQGTSSSPLGEGGGAKTGTDPATAAEHSFAGTNFGATGGLGLDSGKLNGFNANKNGQDRSPASSGPVGGGGSPGSGASSSPESGPTGPIAGDKLNNDSPFSAGGGAPGGGAGGFNLGESKGGASAADDALKSVLNGDGLPAGGDPSLAALEGEGGPKAGDENEGGEKSLFFRVRESYVRCMKRGCVSREIGENI